jgi:hypothetical protein
MGTEPHRCPLLPLPVAETRHATADQKGPSSEAGSPGKLREQQHRQRPGPAGPPQLHLKPHESAFGQGISQRGDTANPEDWSPAAAKAGEACAKFAEGGEALAGPQDGPALAPVRCEA